MKLSSSTLTLKLDFPELAWHHGQIVFTFAQYMLLQGDGPSAKDTWDPSKPKAFRLFHKPSRGKLCAVSRVQASSTL